MDEMEVYMNMNLNCAYTISVYGHKYTGRGIELVVSCLEIDFPVSISDYLLYDSSYTGTFASSQSDIELRTCILTLEN